jgi:DUF4097 and DUF4098 domain-containing protein YvlB
MNSLLLRRFSLLLAGALLLTAAARAEVTGTFKKSYPLAADGRVTLSNINGEVSLTAWDKHEVALEAETYAPDDTNLQRIHVTVDAAPGHLTIKTEHDKVHAGFFWIGSSNARGGVRYRLMVPAGVTLEKVSTVNSDIRCTGVKGDLHLSTVNGRIDATGATGQGRFGTVNGGITISYDRLPADGRIVLDTVNGSNRLTLPKDSSFELVAESLNGGVSCDLPIRLEKSGRHHLRGRVGQGGPEIKLDSVNGGLEVIAR